MNENILLDLGIPLHDRDGGEATGGHLLLPPFQSVLSVAIAMDLDSRSQPSDVDLHQECHWGRTLFCLKVSLALCCRWLQWVIT